MKPIISAIICFCLVSIIVSSCSNNPEIPVLPQESIPIKSELESEIFLNYTLLCNQPGDDDYGLFAIDEDSHILDYKKSDEIIIDFAFAPESRTVFVLTGPGQIKYFPLDSPERDWEFMDMPVMKENEVFAEIEYSSDAIYVLSNQRVVKINLNDPQSIESYDFDAQLQSETICELTVSSSGMRFALNSGYSTHIFDATTGEGIMQLEGSILKFVNDDCGVYSTGKRLNYINFSTREFIKIVDFDNLIYGMSIISSHQALVWTGQNKFIGVGLSCIYVIDVNTKEVTPLSITATFLPTHFQLVSKNTSPPSPTSNGEGNDKGTVPSSWEGQSGYLRALADKTVPSESFPDRLVVQTDEPSPCPRIYIGG